MKSLITFLCLCTAIAATWATDAPQTDNYQYHIDLVNVIDDQVRVELIAPRQSRKTVVFHMPKIIPGTYTVSDFGRYVNDFEAFDATGANLEVEQLTTNSWRINNAEALYKISYLADDTYDATGQNLVSGMSGTNIEEGQNFLINSHGFFGYFEDQEYTPFEITVTKPKDFVASSAYTNLTSTGNMDKFEASDYHFLVDMPLMYCKPDTSMVNLGNTEVLISVYSPNGMVQSSFLKEQFTTLLKSQKDYLDGKLPVERYAFIMYFMDEPLPIVTGALEHNYSSVYCLPEYPQETLASLLVDIASHEFFHIITPLNVHSEEIHYFDFANPDMSEHLWMYEGVTEYFAHHNQVRSGMISHEEYLERMAEKIQNSQTNYNDALSFTKMSKKCLHEHSAEYGNVYQKGALIAMCMDIELHRLSNGQMGVVDMMQGLGEKYGSEKPFKDKKLFKEIKKMTYKDIATFLNVYVDGDTPIPYGEFLGQAGVIYHPPQETMEYTLGQIHLGFNQETGRLIVHSTLEMNAMGHALGYQDGDEFISIQGRKVPSSGIREYIDSVMGDFVEGEILEVKVARKDQDGNESEVILSAPIQKVRKMSAPSLVIDEGASAEEVALRESWLGNKS